MIHVHTRCRGRGTVVTVFKMVAITVKRATTNHLSAFRQEGDPVVSSS